MLRMVWMMKLDSFFVCVDMICVCVCTCVNVCVCERERNFVCIDRRCVCHCVCVHHCMCKHVCMCVREKERESVCKREKVQCVRDKVYGVRVRESVCVVHQTHLQQLFATFTLK